MNTKPSGAELPLKSDIPLPYVAGVRNSLPKSALLFIVLLMVSTAGLMAFPVVGSSLFAVLLAGEVISVAALIVITVRTAKRKATAWSELNTQSEQIIQQVQLRYGVTLTETILYQLVQGGKTNLPDKDGNITLIRLINDPETSTTKLIAAEK